MALLNPPQILPNVAAVLLRAVRGAEGQQASKDELARAVAPAALQRGEGGASGPGSKGFEDTLTACVVIGLFERDGDLIRLHPQLADDLSDRRKDPDPRRLLRELILAEQRNFGLWDSTEGARDLTRALAWYLAQNPLRPPGGWNEPAGVDLVQEAQFAASERVFSNDTRWGAFTRWAMFLGFAVRMPRDSRTVLVPDPTAAIRDVGSALFGSGRTEIGAFVEELGRTLPVLDGGEYRRAVEARMRSDTVSTSSDQLSPSLAHALLRLRDERFLVIEDLADAPMKMRLPDGFGPERTVTHLSLDHQDRKRVRVR
jgi:hypothetical protein